jgi:ribosomal protein S18 acetylase RimI-like enzyme
LFKPPSPKNNPLRRLDTRKDLAQAANLIETCFYPNLDPDGYLYLKQIRRAADDHRLVHWSYAAGELVSYPLNGFVWEEDGQVVGNLSLIPFYWKGQWIFLIANVAVHPEFRRRGIARRLTNAALEHLSKLKISSVWLHVREDNLAARYLYESFHFVERSTRDTLVSRNPFPEPEAMSSEYRISSLARQDWASQLTRLQANYPAEIAWHFSFNPERFKPGFWGSFRRHLDGQESKSWSIYKNNTLVVSAFWESSFAYADPIWLATLPGENQEGIANLLIYIKITHSPARPLTINYPTGKDRTAFTQAGFDLLNTLIWMEIKF